MNGFAAFVTAWAQRPFPGGDRPDYQGGALTNKAGLDKFEVRRDNK
jgi:hypothetical protein